MIVWLLMDAVVVSINVEYLRMRWHLDFHENQKFGKEYSTSVENPY